MGNSKVVTLYSVLIIILGLLILTQAVSTMIAIKSFLLVAFYICISFITESLSIDIGNNTYISLGFAVSIACLFIFPPALAGFVIFIGVFMHFEIENNKILHLFNTSLLKRLFNASAYAIIAYSAGTIYHSNTSIDHILGQFMGVAIFPGLVAMFLYVVMCILIYALLFALVQGKSIFKMIKEYSWIATQFLAMAPIGLLIAITQNNYGWFSIFLFLGPLLLSRYSFIQYLQMKEHYILTINSFTRALDAKDQYTNGHSERVSEYAVSLAKKLKLPDKKIEELKTAALLHDIGKIGVSDMILNKPDKLTLQEMYEIKRHPEIGARIIEGIHFLKQSAQIIRHHHERYDGCGYPDSMAGDEIPYEARIIAVVDAYDAMTSDRAYRVALNKVQAIEIISEEAGRQFDPDVAKAFIEIFWEKAKDAD